MPTSDELRKKDNSEKAESNTNTTTEPAKAEAASFEPQLNFNIPFSDSYNFTTGFSNYFCNSNNCINMNINFGFNGSNLFLEKKRYIGNKFDILNRIICERNNDIDVGLKNKISDDKNKKKNYDIEINKEEIKENEEDYDEESFEIINKNAIFKRKLKSLPLKTVIINLNKHKKIKY